MKKQQRRAETEAVRGGMDLSKKNGPLTTPIYQTSTFEVTDMEEQVRATPTDRFYTRYGNPTHTVAEKAIAELERAAAALLFASGMSAITTAFLALLRSGDHIIAQRDIYGGVTKFLTQWLPKFGVEVTLVDTTDYAQHASAIRPNTKIIHLESPTNPTLRVVDLKKVAGLAQGHGIITIIDSTFSTPINCRPVEFGIDLVMHSGTKYFGGHADLICGILAGRKDLIETVHATRTTLGCNMDPHAAWLLLRGIKTLAVRVQRQNDNALAVARFLKSHPRVRSVSYPFLEGHPQRALAMEQMHGGGGVLSFEIDGKGEDACRFAEALELFTLAPSLGGVESLVTIP
ncbi:MAG TPA: aminotransferase class I/II-fold pyridoxal phosphate-dependent enzyme, partial [Terriglobales bacterium]|nr:aminotransferase class I/II-fold pyridoxal phosphate-dependent enzyme [Terriglobales bacterium]